MGKPRSGTEDWDELAHLDPLWAIASQPQRQFGRWDLDKFLATGEAEVRVVLEKLGDLGYPKSFGTALDFGCGVGRSARSLARYFERVVAIDASPEMIRLASTINSDVENCDFRVHRDPNLGFFQSNSFDFTYTNQVLQHLYTRELIFSYIAELLRVLKHDGLAVLQIPTMIPWRHRVQPRPRLYSVLRRLGFSPRLLYQRLRLHPIRMNYIPAATMTRVCHSCGGRILESTVSTVAGGVESSVYYITKF